MHLPLEAAFFVQDLLGAECLALEVVIVEREHVLEKRAFGEYFPGDDERATFDEAVVDGRFSTLKRSLSGIN